MTPLSRAAGARAPATPPRVATWLLLATLPDTTGDAIAGDLHEEFVTHAIAARGEWAARWWYRWQVARSLAPLFLRSWQRVSVARATAAILAGATASVVPAVALVLLRTFVLQQVPLKTTEEPSLAFLILLLATLLAGGLSGLAAAARLLRS